MNEKSKETTTVVIEVPTAIHACWEAPTKDHKEAVKLAWERFAPDGYGEKHTLLDELEWEEFDEPAWRAVPVIYTMDGGCHFAMGPKLRLRQEIVNFLAGGDYDDEDFKDPDNVKRAVELLRSVIDGGELE